MFSNSYSFSLKCNKDICIYKKDNDRFHEVHFYREDFTAATIVKLDSKGKVIESVPSFNKYNKMERGAIYNIQLKLIRLSQPHIEDPEPILLHNQNLGTRFIFTTLT